MPARAWTTTSTLDILDRFAIASGSEAGKLIDVYLRCWDLRKMIRIVLHCLFWLENVAAVCVVLWVSHGICHALQWSLQLCIRWAIG